MFGDFYEIVDDSEDEACCIINVDHGLNGSTFDPETQQDLSQAESAMFFDDLESFLTWDRSYRGESSPTRSGYHDVAELCGGAGGTGTRLVRRG